MRYIGYHIFVVINHGTIPVRYQAQINSDSPALDVQVSTSQDVVDGRGENHEGDLYLTVGTVEQNTNYDFTVDLIFQQWNAVN